MAGTYFWQGETPETLVLKEKHEGLVEKYYHLNQNFDSISIQLADIQKRDDDCYRIVSELDPLSPEKRKAGFGGINTYADLYGFENSDLLIESRKKKDVLKRQIDLQVMSYDTVFKEALSKDDSLLSVPAIPPLKPDGFYFISSGYGMRFHPVHKRYKMHDGIDFAAEIGEPVYAAGNGVVERALNSSGYGKFIDIDHGFGYLTRYAHLSKINVKKGDKVVRGQEIGKVGNTGTSTGPHLHYEVRRYNKTKNPDTYYVNDLGVEEYQFMVENFVKNGQKFN